MNSIYCTDITGLSWSVIQSYQRILDPAAQLKVEQFKFEQDKCRTLVGNMLLLYALQQHETYQSSHLPTIDYGQYGKPMIKGIQGYFNISHAQDWVICAYSDNSVVGVDIEHQIAIDLNDYHGIMTANEYHYAIANPEFDFFQLWTLKEAVMKASGQGFFLSPTSFELPLPFHNDDRIQIGNQNWFLFSQSFANHYRLSLASLMPIVNQVNCKSISIEQLRQGI